MTGQSAPPPPRVGVGVGVLLIDEAGRVLLTLRNKPPESNCWSIVGGKLDFLEPLAACAVRETFEEVGLEIAIDSLLCVTDHLLPQESQHWVSPAYLGRILRGEASNREPDKTREVRWFTLDELPPNLTMTARNAIEAFRRRQSRSLIVEPGSSAPAFLAVRNADHAKGWAFHHTKTHPYSSSEKASLKL